MKTITAVIGASGAQGAAIVQKLADLGHPVVAVGRTETSQPTPASGSKIADLDDRLSLERAFAGVNDVLYTYPVAFDVAQAVQRTRNLIQACQASNVNGVTFNTSIPIAADASGVGAIDIKRTIVHELKSSSLNVRVVAPTLYLGNLLAPWSVSAIVANQSIVYPLPSNLPISWSAWEDVAVAHHQLVKAGIATIDVSLAGRAAVTGEELATAFAGILGQPHHYVPLPISDFKAGLEAAVDVQAATELAKLYDWLSGEGRECLAQRDSAWRNEAIEPLETWIGNQRWVL